MSERKVMLSDPLSGKQIELPVLEGTFGNRAVDVSGLYRELGYTTFDPGFLSTASCSSRITYIDGEKGVLLYRGYPVGTLMLWETGADVGIRQVGGGVVGDHRARLPHLRQVSLELGRPREVGPGQIPPELPFA